MIIDKINLDTLSRIGNDGFNLCNHNTIKDSRLDKIVESIKNIQNKKDIACVYEFLRNRPNSGDSWDRLARAQEIMKSGNSDYYKALLLFDPLKDKEYAPWLDFISNLFGNIDIKEYFNPALSFQIRKILAENHYQLAAFSLGWQYQDGCDVRIDRNEAAHWLLEAAEHGCFASATSLARIYIKHDSRYQDPRNHLLTSAVKNMLKRASDAGCLHAKYDLALIAFQNKKPAEAIKSLDQIAAHKDCDSKLRADVLFLLSLRYFLGFDVEKNKMLSDYYAALMSMMRGPEKEKYNADLVKLKKIKSGGGGGLNLEAFGYPNPRKMLELIRRPDCSRFYDPLSDIVAATTMLADFEGWENRTDWRYLLQSIQAKRLGLEMSDLAKSTLTLSANYSALSSDGLPILGAWNKPARDRRNIEHNNVLPPAGISSLKGVKGTRDGEIKFDCVSNPQTPAMLFPEDFNVAMTLVFGYPELSGPLWPSLSMESGKQLGMEDKHEVLYFKIWNPEWLGYTAFGSTLYITDNWIGSLCSQPEAFKIAHPDDCFTPEAHDLAKDLIDDISSAGGREGKGQSGRVMIKPDHINLTTEFKKALFRNAYDVYVSVNEVKMMVEGSYINITHMPGGEVVEDRLVALDDPMYSQGHKTKVLSDRYNDIASLIPMFERARQLMGLMYALAELKTKGFQPNAQTQKRINDTRQYYEGQRPLDRKYTVCLSTPMISIN